MGRGDWRKSCHLVHAIRPGAPCIERTNRMNFNTIYEFPIWLFIMLVALFCLSLSIYLTYHRKKAVAQVIVRQRQRPSQQQALVFEAPGLPSLPLLTFCPACGKPAETSINADTCGFCGQCMVSSSRRKTRRFPVQLN